MRVYAKDKVRGKLIDLNTNKPIARAIWFDTETGEYEAFRLDPHSPDGILRIDGVPQKYQNRTRLHFVPAIKVEPVLKEEKPYQSKRKRKGAVPIGVNPLLEDFYPCQHYGCTRTANWLVGDEIELNPILVNGTWWSRGQTVEIRAYCAFHYEPPKLLDHKGDVVKIFEDAGGVRPQWHS